VALFDTFTERRAAFARRALQRGRRIARIDSTFRRRVFGMLEASVQRRVSALVDATVRENRASRPDAIEEDDGNATSETSGPNLKDD